VQLESTDGLQFLVSVNYRGQVRASVDTSLRFVPTKCQDLAEGRIATQCIEVGRRLMWWMLRIWQSRPILGRLRRAMELVRGRTLPQGLLGQAIDYALKRWDVLTRFIADGTLEIDNNLIENAIRPSALGKRNWLFIGHPEAGERSAVIYTLLGSCRRQGINPFDYLKDLFTRLPAAKITEIKRFTPSEWAGYARRNRRTAA